MTVPRDRVVLTASTSDAYSMLFKLLCNPGDEVLVPSPSYPLFEYLAALDSVQPRTYQLDYHGAWSLDIEGLRRATTDRTRAVVVVNPNNPTGSYLKCAELDALAIHCRAHGLALVGDEVFAEYVLDADLPRTSSVLAQRQALTFGLGGLSKGLGLPQLKLGWMVAAGPDELVRPALERLESDLRHLPVGGHAGAGRPAGAPGRRRGDPHRDPRPGHAQLPRAAQGRAARTRRWTCCPPRAAGTR